MDDSAGNAASRFAFNLADKRQPGLTLGQRDDSLLLPFSHNGVEFPIANPGAGINNGGALINAGTVFQLAPAAVAPIALAALLLTAQVTV
jgi:hypothetical protein